MNFSIIPRAPINAVKAENIATNCAYITWRDTGMSNIIYYEVNVEETMDTTKT